MKKILCLLALLIVAPIMFCGCSPTLEEYKTITKVSCVKIQDSYQGGWTTFQNVDKVELRNDSGVAYVYLSNGMIITTSLNNLIINHKE